MKLLLTQLTDDGVLLGTLPRTEEVLRDHLSSYGIDGEEDQDKLLVALERTGKWPPPGAILSLSLSLSCDSHLHTTHTNTSGAGTGAGTTTRTPQSTLPRLQILHASISRSVIWHVHCVVLSRQAS